MPTRKPKARQQAPSIRSLFAMASIAGLYAGGGVQSAMNEGRDTDEVIAFLSAMAFKTADAMMAHVKAAEPETTMTPGKEGFAMATLTGMLAGGGVQKLLEDGLDGEEAKEFLAGLCFAMGREMDRRTKLS